MTTDQPKPSSLEDQSGLIDAISALLSRLLPTEITAKISLKDQCLRVMLESATVPDQEILIETVRQVVTNTSDIHAGSIRSVSVYGREHGEDFPSWQEEFEVSQQITAPNVASDNIVTSDLEESSPLLDQIDQTLPEPAKSGKSFWGSMFGVVTGVAGTVGGAASSAGVAITGTVTGAASAVGGAAVQAGGVVAGTVTNTARAVGGAAVQVGGAISNTAVGVAGVVGNTAMQATEGAGYVLDTIANNPQLQILTKALKVDWLLTVIDRVDVIQAETAVNNLRQKYPDEKPSGIANRIMLEKAFIVGSSGFVSSLVPGQAAALFVVDLAATMAIQAEMIYQIAGAYGLNLREPTRKVEVLAIFGISLGGNAAIKAGLGFARNIPGAGAVIGASSNAAMLYALGHAACRFYEAKLQPSAAPLDLAKSQAESEDYLQDILDQQLIMDEILVHLVLAGKPGESLMQVLPELQALNLNSASLNLIIAKPEVLPSLENLLDQLNQEFAVSLIARCNKVAQADGVITPEEAVILDQITTKVTTQTFR